MHFANLLLFFNGFSMNHTLLLSSVPVKKFLSRFLKSASLMRNKPVRLPVSPQVQWIPDITPALFPVFFRELHFHLCSDRDPGFMRDLIRLRIFAFKPYKLDICRATGHRETSRYEHAFFAHLVRIVYKRKEFHSLAIVTLWIVHRSPDTTDHNPHHSDR